MATLKIWNVEDEIIIQDEADDIDTLSSVVTAFMDEHFLYGSGGEGYEIKIHTNDDLLLLRDEFENEQGDIVGRYEMKV